jgi:hypothetical protein
VIGGTSLFGGRGKMLHALGLIGGIVVIADDLQRHGPAHRPRSRRLWPKRSTWSPRSCCSPRSSRRRRSPAAAQTAGVVHMTGFNYRFVPAIRVAREMVASGELGEIVHFRARYLQSWGWEAAHSWRFDGSASGTGAIGDLGAHSIDLARYLIGEISAVSAIVRTFVPGREVDDAYVATIEFESGPIGTLEASRLATGRINHHAWEINGSRGSLVFDQERMNELLIGDARGFRRVLEHGDWWPPGHIIGWGDTFTLEYLHLLGAIAGRHDVAPAGATFEDGYRCAEVCDAISRSAGSAAREEVVCMKTSLGIWSFGAMGTRFVPGGYQPQWAGESTAGEGAHGRSRVLGDLIDGYEFHYPNELSPENLDAVSRRSTATTSTASRAVFISTRASAGGAVLARRRDARRGDLGDARARSTFAGSSSNAHFIIWPGIEGYNYPFQTPVPGVVGALHRRGRPSRDARAGARRDDLPRAQELRAGDEDPDAERRDDAARDPHAAQPGDRQRQGQHGLAAPDHERREPGRVRGPARRRGLLGHQHANSGWGTFDDDNMVGTTAFMETIELAIELRRAGYGGGERLGFDLYPYTEDAVGGGDAVGAPVAVHRLGRGEDRRCGAARGSARKDAVAAYELVYAALGA